MQDSLNYNFSVDEGIPLGRFLSNDSLDVRRTPKKQIDHRAGQTHGPQSVVKLRRSDHRFLA